MLHLFPLQNGRVETGEGGGGGVTWLTFCRVCAAGLSGHLPHYCIFCGHIIDPILVSHFGKKEVSQSQISRFLIVNLPHKAF